MTAIAALLQQALEHHQAGRLQQAIDLYNEILAQEPRHGEALNLLGVIANQAGRFDIAVDFLGRALDVAPDNAIYLNNHGQALAGLGRLDEAAASYRRALERAPTLAGAYANLALILQRQGKVQEAIALFRRTIEMAPEFPQAHNNLANLLASVGQLDAAVMHYDRALESLPNDAQIHANRGNALQAQGRITEAVESFRRAHALFANDAILLKSVLALPIITQSREEIAAVRARLAAEIEVLKQRGLSLHDPEQQIGQTCFHLAYHALDDLPLQRAIADFYQQACPALLMTAPHCTGTRPPAPPGGRIRIGIVSQFFRTHTISRLWLGMIRELSRERFHVTLVATPCPPDRTRVELMQAADATLEVPLDLAGARRRIADAAFDVIVYADIGMAPLTYFLAFARLAPVQCLTWGHPDTTGIANLDYFVTCDAMEPDGAEAHYSEVLIRLPGPTVHYARPRFEVRLKTAAELGLDPDAHLYVCPQSLFKFHPDFDPVLVAILRRDPAGLLVLIQDAHPHIDRTLVGRITRDAPDVAARIKLMPTLNRVDFVALTAAAHVMLDPLHYSGGNTSLEAFSVGTPIVTWPGEFMRGRHTHGFYSLMGIDDAVARDHDDYVDIAVRLGTNPALRAALSRRILDANGVLFDSDASIRAWEEFLVAADARARRGEPPGPLPYSP